MWRMTEELGRERERICAEVSEPAADWGPFFEDALFLERYAEGEARPAPEVRAAISRIEAVVASLSVERLQDAEKTGVASGWIVACRARQRLQQGRPAQPR